MRTRQIRVATACWMMTVLAYLPAQPIATAAPPVTTTPARADSLADRIGDWFATMGKSETDREAILVERRTKRAAQQAGEAIERGVERTGHAIDQTGDRVQQNLTH